MEVRECTEFCDGLKAVVPGCTVMVGDFNSVTNIEDRQSGKLDAMSSQLGCLLE